MKGAPYSQHSARTGCQRYRHGRKYVACADPASTLRISYPPIETGGRANDPAKFTRSQLHQFTSDNYRSRRLFRMLIGAGKCRLWRQEGRELEPMSGTGNPVAALLNSLCRVSESIPGFSPALKPAASGLGSPYPVQGGGEGPRSLRMLVQWLLNRSPRSERGILNFAIAGYPAAKPPMTQPIARTMP